MATFDALSFNIRIALQLCPLETTSASQHVGSSSRYPDRSRKQKTCLHIGAACRTVFHASTNLLSTVMVTVNIVANDHQAPWSQSVPHVPAGKYVYQSKPSHSPATIANAYKSIHIQTCRNFHSPGTDIFRTISNSYLAGQRNWSQFC